MMKGETVLSGAPHPGTELEVLNSNAGYYLGYCDEAGFPYSRESQYLEKMTAEFMLNLLRS